LLRWCQAHLHLLCINGGGRAQENTAAIVSIKADLGQSRADVTLSTVDYGLSSGMGTDRPWSNTKRCLVVLIRSRKGVSRVSVTLSARNSSSGGERVVSDANIPGLPALSIEINLLSFKPHSPN